MSVYIGIDGGGSKTRFACFDREGTLLAEHLSSSSYYRQLGADAVEKTLMDGVKAVTEGIGGGIAAISFGMPGLGEAPEQDAAFVARLCRAFAPIPFFAANDVAMAFHGAFAGGTGIMLVAGTGSMAWARDGRGVERRCGGWSEFFGDEGSGFWVGKHAIGLFTKESDGRLPKTEFYRLFKEFMSSPPEESDMMLVSRLESFFASRAQVASVHRVLLEAAEMGDAEALRIYSQAARELAGIVIGARRGLEFEGSVPVSCVGGMFNCEKLIYEPLKKNVEAAFAAHFSPPALGPCQGAVLYAASRMGDAAAFDTLRDGMLRKESEIV